VRNKQIGTNNGLTGNIMQRVEIDKNKVLVPGDAISVPLTNANLINCLFKVAGEDVSVIYTV